jgi:hypothetical protein
MQAPEASKGAAYPQARGKQSINSISSTPESATSARTSGSSTRPLARTLSGLEAPDAPLLALDGKERRQSYVPPTIESESDSEESSEDEELEASSEESSDELEDERDDSDHDLDIEADDEDEGDEDEDEDSEDDDASELSDAASEHKPPASIRIEITRRRISIIHQPDEENDLIIEELDSETIEFDNLPVILPSQFEYPDTCPSDGDKNDASGEGENEEIEYTSSDESEDESLDLNMTPDRDRELAQAQREFNRLQINRHRVRRRRWRLGGDHKRKHDQAVGSDLDIEDVVPLLEDDLVPHPQLPVILPTSSSSRYVSTATQHSHHQRQSSNISVASTRRIRRRTEGPEERERPRVSGLFENIPQGIVEFHSEEQEIVIADGDAENDEVLLPPWFHEHASMELDSDSDEEL